MKAVKLMSKLDELIQEYCPDGVEYKKVKDICKILRGKRLTIKDLIDNGDVPVYHGGTQPIGYYHINNRNENSVMIINVGASAGTVGYSYVKFWSSDGCFCFSHNENVNQRYLFFCLQSIEYYLKSKVRKAGIPTLDSSIIENIKIPLLPVHVQEEIVRILDNFTELTENLNTELAVRRKQYEYYREKLLMLKENVPTVELGEVCTFVRGPFGGALKKEIFKKSGFAVYEQQHAIYRNLNFRYYIDSDKFNELKRFGVNKGDMIISCSGTIGKTFVIPDNAPKGIINQALLKLTPNQDLDVFYLQYFFENTISKIFNSSARGGAIKNVPSVNELKKIKIPLPSLETQKRIVDVLDNFEKICSDLNIGLPAEIAARQKQYEYYRDKLLTFKEAK